LGDEQTLGPGASSTPPPHILTADGATFQGLGMSILEMGHRDAGGPVQQVLQEAKPSERWKDDGRWVIRCDQS